MQNPIDYLGGATFRRPNPRHDAKTCRMCCEAGPAADPCRVCGCVYNPKCGACCAAEKAWEARQKEAEREGVGAFTGDDPYLNNPAPGHSLYGGWPLTPSKRRPGEQALTCGSCGGQDISLETEFAGRGTGPGGRPRAFDVGNRSVAVCRSCGARGRHLGEK
jgi:hypothetical protein